VDAGSIPAASTRLRFNRIQGNSLNQANKPPKGGFFVSGHTIKFNNIQFYWGYIDSMSKKYAKITKYILYG